MSRRLAITGVAVAAALLATIGFASRSNAASRSTNIPVLRIGDTTQYSTLDPGHADGCNTMVCMTIYDRLMTFNSQGKLVGALAQSVSQPGAGVYVYHLRHGVKFWDGSELTSADVANSLNYQRYPTNNSASQLASDIKTITAPSKYTVVVTLKHADVGFGYLLALEGPIFEQKFQQEHKATFGQPGTGTMGTGPWMVQSFNPTTGLELAANPHYWGGPVNVKHISIKFFSSEQSEALAFRAGDVDVAFPAAPTAFAATSGAHIIYFPAFAHATFAMNVHKAPWNDVHVRRAVAYAVKRADLIAASGAPGTPANYMIPLTQLKSLAAQTGDPSLLRKVLKSVPTYPYSLAKAKQEMAKSAYPNGFTDTTDTPSFFVPIAEVLKAQLQPLGIKLNINTETIQAWLAEIFGPKTFGAMVDANGWPIPDVGGFPGIEFGSNHTKAGGLNLTNYGPPNVDALLAAGLKTVNPRKRLAIYGQFLKVEATAVPYVPLYEIEASVALSSKFRWPGLSSLDKDTTHWPLHLVPAG